ncbi:MAG TPA: hypothetical protein VIJ57_14665 [Hanamia sp.]
MKTAVDLFDSRFKEAEQLPRKFTMDFVSIATNYKWKTKVSLNGIQVEDIIDDNSKINDFYRYHDVFHYSFATLLGWSPCARAMLKRKRKSDKLVDEIEDGARAAITEEALSMIIFNEAKRKNYFEGVSKVSRTTLRIIKEMTENFEVTVRSTREWENAILKAYEMFRLLIVNHGGRVKFDAVKKAISYSALPENSNLTIIAN